MTETLSPDRSTGTSPGVAASPFSPAGRFGRLRLLTYSVWLPLGLYAIGLLLGTTTAAASELLGAIVMIAFSVLAIVLTILFYIRRCHDFNASGWWAIGMIVPLLNLVYVFIPGTDGTNRFGPKPPPNTWVHWVFGLGGFLIPLVGILAAIAIPAYQDYTSRAMIGEAFVVVSDQKIKIAGFAQTNGRYPNRSDIASLDLDVEHDAGQYADSIRVDPGSGAISVTMKSDIAPAIAGTTIRFCPPPVNEFATLESFYWTCSSDAEAIYLPRSCSPDTVEVCP